MKKQLQLAIGKTENTKHKLLLSILLETGAKLSEIINLRWCDLSTSEIRIIRNDGKERIMPISRSIQVLLRSYAKEYDLDFLRNNEHYIFGGVKPYSKKAVSLAVSKAGERIGIKLTPQDFTNAYIQYLQKSNMPLEKKIYLSGYKSVSSLIRLV